MSLSCPVAVPRGSGCPQQGGTKTQQGGEKLLQGRAEPSTCSAPSGHFAPCFHFPAPPCPGSGAGVSPAMDTGGLLAAETLLPRAFPAPGLCGVQGFPREGRRCAPGASQPSPFLLSWGSRSIPGGSSIRSACSGGVGCVPGLVFVGAGACPRIRSSPSIPGKDVDYMYVNTASLGNGTSFVESLFEEFGTCG